MGDLQGWLTLALGNIDLTTSALDFSGQILIIGVLLRPHPGDVVGVVGRAIATCRPHHEQYQRYE